MELTTRRETIPREFSHLVLVPCSILTTTALTGAETQTIYAAREEEAVAIAAGLHLAGASPLVAFQNSGLANSFNTIGSLALAYNIPLCLMVTLRGSADELNATQMPVGRATESMLDALSLSHETIRHLGEVAGATLRAKEQAEKAGQPHFILFDRAQNA